MKRIFCTFFILAGCQADLIDKETATSDSPVEVELTSQTQNIRIRECGGKIVKEHEETTVLPTGYLQLDPKEKQGLYDARFFNITTKSQSKCVRDNSIFQVGTQNAPCQMQVKQGTNQIFYSYFYCSEVKNGECRHMPELRESGSIYIDVKVRNNYQAETIERENKKQNCKAELAKISNHFAKNPPEIFKEFSRNIMPRSTRL